MKTLESRIKPKPKEAFGIIERNQEYLKGHDILGGRETLKGDLEDFYNLEYHAKRAPSAHNALGLGAENKDKYGSKPNKLIEILGEFTEKSNNKTDFENSNLLVYEKVRDSFNELQFPSWKENMYAGLWIIGLLGAPVSAIYSVETKNLFNLIWSVSLALSFTGLALYTPTQHVKNRFNFRKENFSKEREKVRKNFNRLHNVAEEMDRFVVQYDSLFEN